MVSENENSSTGTTQQPLIQAETPDNSTENSLQSANEVNNDNIPIPQIETGTQPQAATAPQPASTAVVPVRTPDETQAPSSKIQKNKADNKAAKPVYATIEIGGKVYNIDEKRNVVAFTMNGPEYLAFLQVLKQRYENRTRLSNDVNQLTRQCVYASIGGHPGISHDVKNIPLFKDVIVRR